MGCGELLLELKFKMRAMAPGSIMKLTALDPGAPEDMPAWCRLTGHALVRARHPDYWIQKKLDN
ncbi:MAG: sulfurtransferase TusA family protein [Planctomycetes bacterium]|nr:sulfurtransferase TusA family protein [Planctomycetota bacterium]